MSRNVPDPARISRKRSDEKTNRQTHTRHACPADAPPSQLDPYRGAVRDQLPPGLPLDPFAGDPTDPAAALDALEPDRPLDPQERLAVEADLADLAVFEALLAPRGIRGLVEHCEDCRHDHYRDWDMLRADLLQLLVGGPARPHEPAYAPTPEAYATWDYCCGYADAQVNDAVHGPRFDA
ncbi:hypothetical protein MLGJGCBP_01276 [Rhodococcus sp. T7]|nr:hypothetical protein MLGJGCBP_01276 [Rhodococcus sp. T7]